jgi:hypothetical protein
VSDDLRARIDMLVRHSKGTMPIGLLAADKAEAEEALRILAKSNYSPLITVERG